MSSARAVRRAVRLAALTAALGVAIVAGCRSQRTPPTPVKPRAPKVDALLRGGTPALQPYLDAYPLGSADARFDLLAVTRKRSMHLLQTKVAQPQYRRPTRTEITYVVTGSGTCYVDGRSYPATPGATFRVAPGVRHAIHPDAGGTIVAVTYLDPPLVDGDDRVIVQ